MLGRRVLCSGVVALLFTVVGCGAADEPTAQSTPPSTPVAPTTSAPAPSSSAAEAVPSTTPAPVTTTKPGAPSAPASAPAPAPTRPGQPPSQVTPTVTRVAGEPRRDAYLAAITEAGVQVSPTGDAELLIAQGVCKELAKGTPRATVVGYVDGFDDAMTPELAEAVVAAAQRHYC